MELSSKSYATESRSEMAIRIVTSTTGYQHAVAPTDDEPGDQSPKVRTVCAKVVRGPTSTVTSAESIRCRPCKKALYKGRPYQKG